MQLYVSIGRNRGGLPMPARDWRAFQRSLEAVVAQVADPIYTRALGEGEWRDGEVIVREDCYVLVGELLAEDSVDQLRNKLAKLARRYGQDAIALALADTELVAAATDSDEEVTT